MFAAATLGLGYALVVGGAGAADNALNGFGFAAVFVLSNDFVFGPRLTRARRYVLCPWIDFLNHDGALEGASVSYEYFSDAFAARLDPDAGAVAAGKELLISYGARSNDVLLQYYGFVQESNPHDTFAIEQERLILEFDAQMEGGLPAQALPALAAAKLTDANRVMQLTAQGGDEVALRLARLLTFPELAASVATSAREAGIDPLPAAEEASARRTLAAVARGLSKMLEEAELPGMAREPAYASQLLAAYIKEKRRVLDESAQALQR